MPIRKRGSLSGGQITYLASGSDQQPYHAGMAENQRRAAVSTSAFSWGTTATLASACLRNHQSR